jgi:hypothetical protein
MVHPGLTHWPKTIFIVEFFSLPNLSDRPVHAQLKNSPTCCLGIRIIVLLQIVIFLKHRVFRQKRISLIHFRAATIRLFYPSTRARVSLGYGHAPKAIIRLFYPSTRARVSL